MDQEMQVYFTINPDIIGNVEGLHCQKINI